MKAAFAPYRLRFRRPFGTSHGLRTGTDCVFLRLSSDRAVGFGEATLPPYVAERQATLIDQLYTIDIQQYIHDHFEQKNKVEDVLKDAPACRAMLHMAWCDLRSREAGLALKDRLPTAPTTGAKPPAMFTWAMGDEVTDDMLETLPEAGCLKVKVGSATTREELERIAGRWQGKLFMDANQGWDELQQALDLVAVIPEDRLLGVEQPFHWQAYALHAELQQRISVPVFADESIQRPEDLQRVGGSFGGVNIKLMKCGGLDRAWEMIAQARSMDLHVMLGCMSESSLGCGAMASLLGQADLCDLDGPWLLENDPFAGLEMVAGHLVVDEGPGIAVRNTVELPWTELGP